MTMSSIPSPFTAASLPLTIDLVAAARPNFMKIAPLWHALEKKPCREERPSGQGLFAPGGGSKRRPAA